ncbi:MULTISPECIES: phosphate regulon sensor histidine kinase PhoR [unclassified Neisseria]|uniref:phosphate regulon sensor histidine kinase PhoR n=1 Tax=unclassified Neisseria TaxID=2623750 RepID=UPI002665B6E3|nr:MULTISPECIES: phosphate regulon sensor histidine kinase PhoR [unclassified Neisseria]MDO1509777.1 phosphate regulon sensor histidine kinase PhoR [Neisseria sp. MVDL19-042950]MDO1515899.1 phosphate regulon sensor histidine kinase PhoR [Neisseria sp. MVDL18-041461]MDO1563012.1 phosphate regulon sensor histidine kinase PhoR [Neisseria sp. MVDL20-010259]
MGFVWHHIAGALFGLTAAALIGYAVDETNGLLLASCGWLGGWLVYQFYYIFKLVRWLATPKTDTAPPAGGMWSHVFDAMLQQAKSRNNREQKLTTALQRFNRAVEAMPNGVLILDRQGRIGWMNPLAVQHLNLSPHSDWNSLLKNRVHIPALLNFLDSPPATAPEIKITLPKSGGIGTRTLLVAQAVFDGNEKLLITRDISETEQLNATRTAFVANVSHELRTPLTVINGFLETMADMPGLPREQSQQFIGLMQKEGRRMQTLLADLLTLSRLESGAKAELSPVNLSALAASLTDDADNLSAGKHTIRAEIEPDLWMKGAPADLYTALSNLVFNAVRYTPEGGEITVSLHLVPSGNPLIKPRIRFAVRDNGPGISAEHLPRLTERFYRVDKGRSRRDGGTGLGLSIAKHVLAAHGSALQIWSEVGKGSEFSAEFRQTAPPEAA